MPVSKRWSTLVIAVAVLVGTLIACGSSDSGSAASTPEGGFCSALTDGYAKCKGASSCADPLRTDCAKLASILNPSVLAAATTCIQASTCDSDPLTCLGKSLTDLTPSAAQAKLATDFCASCASVGGDPCEKAFFGTGSTPGLGFALLPFGDGPLGAIDDACTSNTLGKVACQASFSSCVSATATKFLATSFSVDTASCLLSGIKDGLTAGPTTGTDGGPTGGGCTNCAGCCQDGKCQMGSDVAACGSGGGACEKCSAGGACTVGKCVTTCGPDNCAGCCDSSGQCQTGSAAATCGSRGAACTPCTGTKTCQSGQCIDAGCKASCATGCCTAAGCQPGGLANACGTGGNACADCGTGLTCAAGMCGLDPASKWDFVLVGAHLPAKDGSGGDWDSFGGLPDPYANATSGATTGAVTYVSDTLTPVWNMTALADVTAMQLETEVKLDLWDDDVAFDDHIGLCSVKLTAASFDGVLHTAMCPAAGTDVAFTVDFRLKTH